MIGSCLYGKLTRDSQMRIPFCIAAWQATASMKPPPRYFTRFLYDRFFGFLNLLSEVSAMPR